MLVGGYNGCKAIKYCVHVILQGWSALHMAVHAGHAQIVERLLRHVPAIDLMAPATEDIDHLNPVSSACTKTVRWCSAINGANFAVHSIHCANIDVYCG